MKSATFLPKQKKLNAIDFTSSHFSFNMEGGRCEACRGYGYIENVEDAAEAEVLCPECNGKRFSKEVLSILYQRKKYR